jgi:hypothetical protein
MSTKCGQKGSDKLYFFFHTSTRGREVRLQVQDFAQNLAIRFALTRAGLSDFGTIPSVGHGSQCIQATADTQSHA